MKPLHPQSQVFHSATALYSFSPCAVVHPTTEAEIVQTIQSAAQQGLPVRAIGALHSQAPIPTTQGVCIVLDRYNSAVKIAGSLVSVQAGMRLWELNEILANHNLALPTLGAIAEQTVSGAISTGTHGGSLYHSSLSATVQDLRLVRADGSVIQIDCSQDIFKAVGISMGLLGIISTVTFKCVPAFSLQSQVCTLSMDAFLHKFDEIHQHNQYVDIKYSPIADSAQVLLMNPPGEAIAQNGGCVPRPKPKLKRRLENFVTAQALHLFQTHRFNRLQRWLVTQYELHAYAVPYGRSDFVLTHFEAANDDLEALLPVSDMELAIPYSQATAALTCLRKHFDDTQKFPSMSIHIRCSAQEDFWLSPAWEEAVCWLEFWEYPRTGKFFKEMVELLLPFKFRCHWGKQIAGDPEYLQQGYKNWRDFVQLRQEWDPQGLFANSCLDHYFSSVKASSSPLPASS